MSRHQLTARAVGALFLVSYLGFAVGAALMAPARDPETLREALADDQTRIVIGALGEFANDVAVVGIAVLLFPLLKSAGEGLALWYVGLRVFEGTMFMLASAAAVAIPAIAKSPAVGDGETAAFEAARQVAIGLNDGADLLATAAFVVGALLLYTLLYRSRIVPRFIALWGFAAVALLVVVNIVDPDLTSPPAFVAVLVGPIVLNELFLAGWLLVKGVRVPAAEPLASAHLIAMGRKSDEH